MGVSLGCLFLIALLNAPPALAYKLDFGSGSIEDVRRCWAQFESCYTGCRNMYCNGITLTECWQNPNYVACWNSCETAYKGCLKSSGVPTWSITPGFVNGASIGVACEALARPLLLNPAAISVGEVLRVAWFDDSGIPQAYPATIDSVVFVAVKQSVLDSTWAADSSLANVDFVRLGLAQADPLPGPEFTSSACTAYGYALTLPNVFELDTPYTVLAYITDASHSPATIWLEPLNFAVTPSAAPATSPPGMLVTMLGLALVGALVLAGRRAGMSRRA